MVPCRASGKKTRRFQIRLEDVITFLRKRDEGLLENAIPIGGFSSKSVAGPQPRYGLDSGELCAFLVEKWQGEPDMLTSRQAAALCGYNMYTINRRAQDRLVKAVLYYGKYLISKDSLAEFLSSGAGQGIAAMPELHRNLLEEFCVQQQNSAMELGSMAL